MSGPTPKTGQSSCHWEKLGARELVFLWKFLVQETYPNLPGKRSHVIIEKTGTSEIFWAQKYFFERGYATSSSQEGNCPAIEIKFNQLNFCKQRIEYEPFDPRAQFGRIFRNDRNTEKQKPHCMFSLPS